MLVHEAHVAAEVIAGELQGTKPLGAAAFNAIAHGQDEGVQAGLLSPEN